MDPTLRNAVLSLNQRLFYNGVMTLATELGVIIIIEVGFHQLQYAIMMPLMSHEAITESFSDPIYASRNQIPYKLKLIQVKRIQFLLKTELTYSKGVYMATSAQLSFNGN